MINIYNKKEANFNHNGLASLNECIKCVITEKLNNEFELVLSYPLHLPKAKFIRPFNVIKADGQLFRIYNIEKDSNLNIVNVNARHIFYDLMYALVENANITDKTCNEALNAVVKSTDIGSSYIIKSNITTTGSINITNENVVAAIFKIVDTWDGELKRNNFTISINGIEEDLNKVATINHGKNIIGINEKINCDNVMTKIFPVGANNLTLPEKYLINTLWQISELHPDFVMTKKVEFNDVTNITELQTKGQRYLYANMSPNINYKIDFIKLYNTLEYEKYKVLQKIEVGNIVEVKHELMGIDIKVKVIGIEKDILNDKNTKVELGNPLSFITPKMKSLIELYKLLDKLQKR